MAKKFQIGVKDLHCGTLNAQGDAYENIAPIEGLKSVNLTISKDSVSYYADDVATHTINTMSSVEVEFEVHGLTIDERKKLLGYNTNKGALAITPDAVAPSVGIAFRSLKSDQQSYRYFAIHNIKFVDPSDELVTREDSVEETTLTMTGTALPLTAKGNVIVIMADDDDPQKDDAYLRDFLTTIPTELPL